MRPAYLLILGDEEANSGTVSYMGPDREQVNGVALADFVAMIEAEISSRSASVSYTHLTLPTILLV